MARKFPGVPFTGPATTTDDRDTFPTHYDDLQKGGFRVVTSTSEMNSITTERRKEGMFVYNLQDKKLYTLKNNNFEIYEVSGIDEKSLFNLIKSEDPSVFEVNIDINDITTLIPKLKELEDLSYVSDKTYEFEEVAKTPFYEITLDGLTFSTVTQNPQGNQTKTVDLIIKEENYEKYVTASITDLEFPAWTDPGLSGTDLELQNIFTEYMMVSFGGASGKLEKGLKFSQYFEPVYYENMFPAMKSSNYNLYQTEVLINGELSKAKLFHTLYPTFMGYILVERAKVESKTVNIELKIKTKQEFTYDKYLLLYKNTQGLRNSYGVIDYLPYTIKNGKPYITGTSINNIDQRQADKIGFVVDKENVVKYLNQVATNTDIPNKIIVIDGKTLTYKLAQDTSNANLWGLELKNKDASKFAEDIYNVVFDYPFDLETNGIQIRKTENAKEALDVALNKIDELESGAYSPELIISDDKILSTRERINNGIAIAHTGTHNAKDIDLDDIGLQYSGSKFPEFKYSLQNEYVLKTASSNSPDLKLVKQNGKYRIVGELKNWVGISDNMLMIPILNIDGVTEANRFYDTVYFMQQFFNYPSQVISGDLTNVDNAKVLTSEEILIEGIEDELQLTFLTYPQLFMIIFKTDKSNFGINSANIKLSIEQTTEDYFDTTLPYMTQNFMSIGKLKLEDVDGEVHIKGTITNRLDKGSPANSILISSTGAIIENYFDNMQSPELLNTITSASNTEYNYQISIDHSGQYGDMCAITLTGTNPIQNDEVITVDIPVKKNKNVIVEKAPENVEEAIKILKDNSISGSIDGSIGILDSKLYSNEYNKRSSLIALDHEISIQGTFNSLDENIKYMDLPIFIDTEVYNKGTQFYVANYKNGYRLKGKGVLSKNTTTSIIQIIPSSYGEMDKIKAIAFNLIKPIKPVDIENDINNTDGIMELQPGDSVGDFVSGKVSFVSFLGNLSLLLSGQPTVGDNGDIIEFDIGVDPIWSNKVISENFTLNLINKNGSVQLNGDIPAIKSRDETGAAEVNIEFYSPYLKNYFTDGLTIGGISNTNFALYDDLDKSSTTEVSGTFTKSGDYKFLLHLNISGALADNMLLSFYMDADTNETITDQERECVNLTEALKVLSGKIGEAGNIIYDNDSPMPEKVGGYDAGTTFDNVTLLDLLTGLLYPFQYPKFTTFTTTMKKQFKLGEGSGTSMEVSWDTSNKNNIKPDSIEIKVDGSAKLNTITTNSGTDNLTITEMKLTTSGTKQAIAKLVNTKGTEATSTITFSWVNTYYYGESAELSLDESKIKALRKSVDSNSLSSELSFNEGNYKYIVYPSAWGDITLKDKNTGFGVDVTDVGNVQVTNEFSVQQEYKVIRSTNILNSSLTVLIIK